MTTAARLFGNAVARSNGLTRIGVLALFYWTLLGAAPRIVEYGPTFRSNLGAIGFTPDGSTWVAESDGVARITADGRITEKRRPDDCHECWWSATNDIVVHGDGAVESGGYTYVGTPAGGIAFLRNPAVRRDIPKSPESDVVARGADGATWSFITESRNGPPKDLVFKKHGLVRRNVAKIFSASHFLTNFLVAPDDALIASIESKRSAYHPNGGPEWPPTQIVRITPDGVVTPFASVPNRGSWGNGIACWKMAADGTIWLTEADTNRIARIDPNGSIAEYEAGVGLGSALNQLAVDRKGDVWADDTFYGRVIRLAPDGTVTVFGSGISPENTPGMPAPAFDGGIWFFQTLSWHFRLTRIAPGGEMREYSFKPELTCGNAPSTYDSTSCTEASPFPALQTRGPDAVVLFPQKPPGNGWVRYVVSPRGSVTHETMDHCFVAELNFVCGSSVPKMPNVSAAYAVIGPDKALWFSDPLHSRIARADRRGRVVYYSRGLTRWNSGPQYMTIGPDGALWFTEIRDRIGRISVTGAIKEFSNKLPFRSFPGGIVTGRDGNLWFTLYHGNELVRMTPRGAIRRFRAGIYPSHGDDYSTPDAYLQLGPDGRMWFNEPQGGRIAGATLR